MNNILISYNLVNKWNFLKSLDVIKWSLFLALVLGIFYFIIIQFLPNSMIWISMILSAIGLLVLGFLLFVDNSYSLTTYNPSIKVFAIAIFVCGLLLLGYTWWSSHQIKVASVFVEGSTRFLSKSLSTLIYIPIFIITTFGFIALIIFQYLSFSASNGIYTSSNDIYWNSSRFSLWNILNGVELLWGIFILRDSFNFVMSGNAVQLYFP